jgi:DNA polymerase-4
LRNRVGECLTCSIGIVPKVFLGTVDSELQKPDRLVVLTKDDLAEGLLRLTLHEIYGIGERMEQRLHRAGIFIVAQLWRSFSLASSALCRIAALMFRNGVAWRRKFG